MPTHCSRVSKTLVKEPGVKIAEVVRHGGIKVEVVYFGKAGPDQVLNPSLL